MIENNQVAKNFFRTKMVYLGGLSIISTYIEILQYSLIGMPEKDSDLGSKGIYKLTAIYTLRKDKGLQEQSLFCSSENKDPFLRWVDTRQEVTDLDTLLKTLKINLQNLVDVIK